MQNKDSKIFISGGGSEKDSYLLDKEFVDEIVAMRKGSVLYIPLAMEEDRYASCYDWIINSLMDITEEFIDIEMWTNLDNKTLDDLKKFSAIYIGGGNTFKLLQHIYNSNFSDVLMEYINEGGIVYGGSAGAIILGKNINTVPEENDADYKHEKGLSIIGEYSIICHYQENLDANIGQYLVLYNNPVIALSEKTGLVISGKKARVAGSAPAVIFDINGKKNILDVGRDFLF